MRCVRNLSIPANLPALIFWIATKLIMLSLTIAPILSSLRGSEATEAIHKENPLIQNAESAKRFQRFRRILKGLNDSNFFGFASINELLRNARHDTFNLSQ